MRIALIFDRQTRPETTGVYCERALRAIAKVNAFSPSDLPGLLECNPFDLYLNIDDGLQYRLPAGLTPSVYWAIDTHMDLAWARKKSRDFDFVMAAQKDGATTLKRDGIQTDWLPLGCDPEIHQKHGVEKAYDVCFVGNIVSRERQELLDLLRHHFPNMYVGNRYFEDMAKMYSASRIVFNRSVNNDLNMRVFEALACGSLLVTNELKGNGQAELFQDGIHLATYDSAEELLDKVRFYLKHDRAREKVAEEGRHEVLAWHTYRHRMETLLKRVNSQHSSTVSVGVESHRGDDLWYYEFARPELLALVPATATNILDIGCGTGRLGMSIKERQDAKVVGIELNPVAAHAARTRLDDVIEGDVEQCELSFSDGRFDCVVCGDVLEHLLEPEKLLERIRGWLAEDGSLVASLPNVRHHSVVTALLDGNWTYERAGLLDETHLRFFTRLDMIAMFEQAGFILDVSEMVRGDGHDEWKEQGRPTEVRFGTVDLSGYPADDAEEFFVYQFLFRVRPIPQGHGGATKSRAQPRETLDESTNDVDTTPQPVETSVTVAETSLRILYVGDFESPGKSEQYAAGALRNLGYKVHAIHDASVGSVDEFVDLLARGNYDCFLFHKGCIGVTTVADRLHPTGDAIAEVLRRARIPGYTWYFDRALDYQFDPSREAWMRKVAPLCRVAFVTDGALAKTNWARWHVLRQGVSRDTVEPVHIPEHERTDIGFIGQVYGQREAELTRVTQSVPVNIITGVFGTNLNHAVCGHKIILGPDYPSAAGYWSNRLYVVLGHGGFFLAPEVEGMRDEGFVPGLHYAALGKNPVDDIAYWLKRPAERNRIARAGQRFVLEQYTYEHRVTELVRIIQDTL